MLPLCFFNISFFFQRINIHGIVKFNFLIILLIFDKMFGPPEYKNKFDIEFTGLTNYGPWRTFLRTNTPKINNSYSNFLFSFSETMVFRNYLII